VLARIFREELRLIEAMRQRAPAASPGTVLGGADLLQVGRCCTAHVFSRRKAPNANALIRIRGFGRSHNPKVVEFLHGHGTLTMLMDPALRSFRSASAPSSADSRRSSVTA